MTLSYSNRTLVLAALLALLPIILLVMFAPRSVLGEAYGQSVTVSMTSRPTCADDTYPRSIRTILDRGIDGGYAVDACINGRGQHAVVDPRVESVILKWDDAVELDLRPNHLSYDVRAKIRGETMKLAPVQLKHIRIGGVDIRNVPAFVARDDDLKYTLIGRAFLDRLAQHGTDESRQYVLIAR